MTAPIATTEPLELRAGLTWEWERDLFDYPAPTWVLTYWFKQQAAAGGKFSVIATAVGTFHHVKVLPATNDAYAADDYSWVAVASDGTDSIQVDSGNVRLLPKYNADEALDDRSHAKKVLEAIEAVIADRATKDQEEFTIISDTGSQRSLKRTPLADLIKLRARYKAEVLAERIAAGEKGLGTGRIVYRL